MTTEMPHSTLTIIIVSWNTSDLLRDCLASVYANPPDCEFDLWVVDNASSDNSVDVVQQQFPQVNLLINESNIGFAEANNQAIEASQSTYVLLLNPDTIAQPESISSLVKFMEQHPEAGAAGSRLLNPDQSLQPSCHPQPTLAREFWRMFHLDLLHPYGSYKMELWNTDVPHDVDIIQGASLILRREVIDRIGFLDATYFMYSEEVDLCYRMQQAGWRLYWVPQSRVIHYGGQSTRQIAEKMFLELYRGKVIFFRKHYGTWSAKKYKAVLFLAALPRILAAVLAHLAPVSQQRNRMKKLGGNYRRLLTELPHM